MFFCYHGTITSNMLVMDESEFKVDG
jgi:hypothetical protein